jgi:hypothetical protein
VLVRKARFVCACGRVGVSHLDVTRRSALPLYSTGV